MQNYNPKLKLLAITFFLLLGFFGPAKVSQASITPPWSTTFSCADWNQYSDPLNCDGIGKGGGWTTSTGLYDQITSTANNSQGEGGKGFRHHICTGKNDNGGGFSIAFNTPQTEFWIRWYLRYELGMTWNSCNQKLIYSLNANQDFNVNLYSNKLSFRVYNMGGSNISSPDGTGWLYLMRNAADGPYGFKYSDGQWHYMEVHVKKETSGQTNGVGEIWVDGVLMFSQSNFTFGNAGVGWNSILLPSNQESPIPPGGGSGCTYLDYDDIAISNTGYIGPLGGTGTNPPVMSNHSPINNYTYPSGTSSVTMSLNTDVDANCKYDTSDAAYNSMANTFSTGQGTTSHSQSISTSDGNSYTYYARCDVASGGYPNASSSVLSWNVSTDITPPSAPTGVEVQ